MSDWIYLQPPNTPERQGPYIIRGNNLLVLCTRPCIKYFENIIALSAYNDSMMLRYYFINLHLTDEETETWRALDLPEAIQPAMGKARIPIHVC